MTVKTALRSLNNAVLDLQSADYNTYERPLERMAAALRSDALRQITEDLKSKADFEDFLARADQGGSMMGSARLIWPESQEEELGLIIQLIERAAEAPDWFLGIAHRYYYGGSKILSGIRKITSSVIVPFNRDFATYVEEHAPPPQSQNTGNSMTIQQDKEDLLQCLFELHRNKGERPSIINAGMQYFPEWPRDRLFDAAQALQEDGSIVNPSGGMVHVDLTSTGRKLAEQRSAAPTSAVTYNIGSMSNSPLQHVSPGGNGVQNVQYTASDIQQIVDLYKAHVDTLGLDENKRKRADAQIATIEAQLLDEPDPTIIKAAGRSLKTIIEGAIGGAMGTAISAAPVWAPLLTMFS